MVWISPQSLLELATSNQLAAEEQYPLNVRGGVMKAVFDSHADTDEPKAQSIKIALLQPKPGQDGIHLFSLFSAICMSRKRFGTIFFPVSFSFCCCEQISIMHNWIIKSRVGGYENEVYRAKIRHRQFQFLHNSFGRYPNAWVLCFFVNSSPVTCQVQIWGQIFLKRA